VLRYWEQEFPQLSPVKRRGNRRYYQREDVELVRDDTQLAVLTGVTPSVARASVSVMSAGSPPVEIQAAIRESLSDLEKARSLLSTQFNPPTVNLGMIRVRSGRSAVW
jgi:DNA-binding transcriptional MerR regulator